MGRRRKDPDTMTFGQFWRVGLVLSRYEQARQRGEKHDGAICYAVTSIKAERPLTRISETEVKRILAKWQPKGKKQFQFTESELLEPQEVDKHRFFRQKVIELMESKRVKVRRRLKTDSRATPRVIRFGFLDAPPQPRLNKKQPEI